MKRIFDHELHGFHGWVRPIHEGLSRSIIGVAIKVLNELKPGLDEKLYERAMAIELRRCGHTVALQGSYLSSTAAK
jgi:hypothetical protein